MWCSLYFKNVCKNVVYFEGAVIYHGLSFTGEEHKHGQFVKAGTRDVQNRRIAVVPITIEGKELGLLKGLVRMTRKKRETEQTYVSRESNCVWG